LGGGLRLFILILGILIAVVALGSAWVDEGEVVELTTYDASAHEHETELWIVDIDGRSYVRADLPGADWLERLRAHPEALLRRDGVEERVTARPVDDPAVREAIARAMAEKYGFVDDVVGILRDEDAVVPVILEPIPTASR
jgi:hypothetical protein